MTSRLQSIRDTLAEALQSIPNNQLRRLVYRAKLQADAALMEYPARQPLSEPTVNVKGFPYTAGDVDELLEALSLATNVLNEVSKEDTVNIGRIHMVAGKAYDQIMRTEKWRKENADQNADT